MKSFNEKISIIDLRETYHEMGDYSFKIILNPKHFKSSHESNVCLYSTTHDIMECDVKKWGRKINCSFKIDQFMQNGVCMIEMDLIDDNGVHHKEIRKFWVVT